MIMFRRFVIMFRRFMIMFRRFMIMSRRFMIMFRRIVIMFRRFVITFRRFIITIRRFMIMFPRFIMMISRFMIVTRRILMKISPALRARDRLPSERLCKMSRTQGDGEILSTENTEGSSGNREMTCQRSLLSVIFRAFRGLIQRRPNPVVEMHASGFVLPNGTGLQPSHIFRCAPGRCPRLLRIWAVGPSDLALVRGFR